MDAAVGVEDEAGQRLAAPDGHAEGGESEICVDGCSMMLPSFITRITSLSLIVESLWATTKLVLPFIILAKAF